MSPAVRAYPHQKAGHCGSGALRDLMEWAGLGWGDPPSEGLVFTLGGALDFAYMRAPALLPPIYLVGRGADLEIDLLRRLDASAELRQTEDPGLGWKWVTSEIDAGRPVMVWADIAELPYLRVRLRMSRHDIVIIGYDDDARVAYVVDNDRDSVQPVPYEAMARARASAGFPVPTRHATYIVDWPTRTPELRGIAADALDSSARTLRHGRANPIAAPSPTDLAETGLRGIRAFAADVGRWPQVFDETELDIALLALPAFIEKAGTGGGLFRRLLAQGCRDIAENTRDPYTLNAAIAAHRAGQTWSAVAVAAAATDRSAVDRVAQAASLAEELPRVEEALADALEDAARSLREKL